MIKVVKTLPLCLLASALLFSKAFAANSPSFLMGYWGNWHVWDRDKNGRSLDEYEMPGSVNSETGKLVVNPVLQKQVQNLTAVSYAFLEVYPDVGMFKDVPQLPIQDNQRGVIYFSDPWTDLVNNSANQKFCPANPISCYFAYQIQKDPNNPRPPVDPRQPWNYIYMGNFDAFTKLNGVKHIISIGGWFHEASFEEGAFKNPAKFIDSVILLINKARSEGGTIDGVDFDYEPANGYTAENGAKLASLATQLRQALNANGMQNVIITAAMFANPSKLAAFGADNLRTFAQAVNYIGLMGYDFHGVWDNPAITGLQSNLLNDPSDPVQNDFSVDNAVKAFLAVGVPTSKLIMGVPSYGRVVAGVSSAENNGLYQVFAPGNAPVEDLDIGQVSYYKMIGQWINKGYTDRAILVDGKTIGAWAYNPTNQQFVSYDNTAVIDSKVAYVKNQGLSGMMMWELIGDISPDDVHNASLLKHMHDGLLQQGK